MRDTYQYWGADYAPPREEYIDPMESDEATEEYIERHRLEFHEEWFQYLDEDGQECFSFSAYQHN